MVWADGDEPGAKVEIHVISRKASKDSVESLQTKLVLTKIDTREEWENVDLGGGMKERRAVAGSVKNLFIEKVKLLKSQVSDFAQGETEQMDLFQGNPEPVAAH